jgi:hypothetical protein
VLVLFNEVVYVIISLFFILARLLLLALFFAHGMAGTFNNLLIAHVSGRLKENEIAVEPR